MKKLIYVLMMSLIITLSLMLTAEAAFTDVSGETATAAATLYSMGIVDGTGGNRFSPDSVLTRSQICAMAVRTMGYSDHINTYARKTLFSDVPSSSWYNGYVNLAYAQGVINGYGDGNFGPEDPITYGQLATILLRMLGYTSDEIGYVWPMDYTDFFSGLGLSDGMDLEPYQALTRGEAAILFYRTLKCNANNSKTPYYMTIKGAASTKEVILLDNNATSNGKSGLLKTCSASDGSEAVYYTQGRLQGDFFDGTSVILLFNNEGAVIGTIPSDEEISDSRATSLKEVILLDINASYNGETALIKAVALDGSEGVTYYTQIEKQASSHTNKVMTLILDEKDRVMGMLPGSQTYADTEIVTKAKAILLDVNASKNNESGLLQAYLTDGSSEIVYYNQEVLQKGYFVDTMVTLLLNGAGRVVGTIPESTSYQDIKIESFTASEIVSSDGKSYRIPSDAKLIVSGETYQYTTSGYLQLNGKIGNTIRLFYNESGSVFYLYLTGGISQTSLAVVASSASAESSLARQLGISNKNYTITKNGAVSNSSDLAIYDVGYYDAALNTLRVCDWKVSGYISSASPSISAAETITVAGHKFDVLECAWETLKSFDMGDKITLLLTDDGSIAAVYKAFDLPADMVGVLSKDGKSVTLTGSGITLSAKNMDYDDEDLGGLVTISTSDDSITCKPVSASSSSKVLNFKENTVGGTKLASKYEVYEWTGKGYVYDLDGNQGEHSSTLEEIKGTDNLSSSYVSYFHTNSAGLVDIILLKDITGNLYTYGKLTITESETKSPTEKIDWNVPSTLTNSSGTSSNRLSWMISGDDGYYGVAYAQSPHDYVWIVKLISLEKTTNVTAENFFQANGDWYVEKSSGEYKISENVEIYISEAGAWLKGESALIQVLTDGYELTLYHDATSYNGGQVRIIVASPQK